MYNQLPIRIMKDTKMIEIENTICDGSVKNVNPEFQIEKELWGAAIILRKVNNRVYICSCSARYDEYMCKKKHTFFTTVTSNYCIGQNVVGISLKIEHMHLFFSEGKGQRDKDKF